MAFDMTFLPTLIDAADPLAAVWDGMLSLWQAEAEPADLVRFYHEREETFSRFEEALAHGYFEVYDLLLERARQQDGGYVKERLNGDGLVIIADSLSVREVGLLQRALGEQGWPVEVAGFAVAPFPTLTESLSTRLLGTNPAGGKDTPAFRYRYVTGPEAIPNLSPGEPTLVWLRLPDQALEQVTAAQATTIADALGSTVETLTRLLAQAGSRPVFLTSDHGYVYATSPNHYWQMPDGVEAAARKVFSRESRAQPLSKEGARDLQHFKPASGEEPYFAFTDTHVGLRGRFWWASARPNDRCTGHGGLSLAESLAPVLSLEAG